MTAQAKAAGVMPVANLARSHIARPLPLGLPSRSIAPKSEGPGCCRALLVSLGAGRWSAKQDTKATEKQGHRGVRGLAIPARRADDGRPATAGASRCEVELITTR